MGSRTTRVYWFNRGHCLLKLEFSRVTRGVTWHKTTVLTAYLSINKHTRSSMSEPTTSGGVRDKSFVPISSMRMSGAILEITPRSYLLNFGTVRPPTPCMWISAVPSTLVETCLEIASKSTDKRMSQNKYSRCIRG